MPGQGIKKKWKANKKKIDFFFVFAVSILNFINCCHFNFLGYFTQRLKIVLGTPIASTNFIHIIFLYKMDWVVV